MSSQITFDEDSNIFSKSYDNSTFSFTNTYDNDGNIISDERNAYTYDSYGQLLSVSGENNSSYTYDDRGNILTKSNGTDEVTYSYGNADWQDQLTSVNDTVLTYDENGNLATYGDTQYTWTHGKWLESITDGDNSYAYVYDSNGIRASKTVNGITTNFDVLNSTLYAQTDGTNKIYFQYKGSTPLGFILNDVQYFYITNLGGDVVGITDADGNLIAEYTYDEWGKLLAIDTAEEDNEEQLALAELNPLRYRGYYYDNETGLYYLQSRYYNPELGRFISSDSFDYINTSSNFNLNGYIYCLNCPTTYIDINGETPQLAINWAALLDFGLKIKDKLVEKYHKLADEYNNLADKATTAFNNVTNFFVTLPDRISDWVNNGISKIKTNINELNNKITNTYKQLAARLQNIDTDISRAILELISHQIQSSNKDNSESSSVLAMRKAKSDNSSSSNNAAMAIFQGLFGGIVLDFFNDILEFFGSSLESLSNMFSKVNLSGLFEELMYTGIAIFTVGTNELKDTFDIKQLFVGGSQKFFDRLVDETDAVEDFESYSKGLAFSRFLSIFGSIISLTEGIDNADNGVLSKNCNIILALISFIVDIASMFITIPVVDDLVASAGRTIPKITALRIGGYVIC